MSFIASAAASVSVSPSVSVPGTPLVGRSRLAISRVPSAFASHLATQSASHAPSHAPTERTLEMVTPGPSSPRGGANGAVGSVPGSPIVISNLSHGPTVASGNLSHGPAGSSQFDFMSLRRTSTPPPLDFRLARHGDRPFSHDEAARQDAATIAVNADRILREAQERLEAERAEQTRMRKKERKIRYVMADSDPLIRACKKGDDERVRELIAGQEPEDIVDYVNARDKNGSTPIFHTVWVGGPGHLESLRILLENGADANLQNNRQNTALHLACEREHADIILTLVQFGASITLLNLNNQTCFQTLADPVARSKMENFCKRCWNDVRRGHMGEQKYRLPKPPKRAPFWSASFYESNYFADHMTPAVAAQAASLPASSELRRAVEEPKPQTNEGGVPDPTPFFYDFLARKLRRADPETAADARRRAKELVRQQQQENQPREAQTNTSKSTPSKGAAEDDSTRTNSPTPFTPARLARKRRAAPPRKRRKSLSDLFAVGSIPPVVRSTLRRLEVLVDVSPAQKQLVQFLVLMHPPPARLPRPSPLPEPPAWLVEYAAQRAVERAEAAAREAALREASRPRATDPHSYALTRLRTAAFAGAASPHFHARMMSSSRASIPHASAPNLVKPAVALLRDLTIHLPPTTTRPTASSPSPAASPSAANHANKHLGSSASMPSLRHVRSPSTPLTPSSASPVESWDATRIAMDREQSQNVLKNPAYSNWVLRQLSALHEVADAQQTNATNPVNDPNADARHAAAIQADASSMHIRDAELRGLVDHEVERLLRVRYGGPTTAAERDAQASSEVVIPLLDQLGGSSSDKTSASGNNGGGGGGGARSTAPLKSKVPLHLANFVPTPLPPSPRLNALAAELLVDEKESYLRGLYVQIHTVLTRLKKSATLYIPPGLARKMRHLNPGLLAVIDPASQRHLGRGSGGGGGAGGGSRLDTGGVRPEYATLGFSSSQQVAAAFESQVRDLIEQRRRVREEAMVTGADQHWKQFEAEMHQSPSQRGPFFTSPAEAGTTSYFSSPPPPATAPHAYETPNSQARAARSNQDGHSRSTSVSVGMLASSPSSKTLSASASAASLASPGSALHSAAMQRALIAQYNPRILSPFSGGGSYERAPSSSSVNGGGVGGAEFKLNTGDVSMRQHHLPKLGDEPQVLEIHHSPSYATYRQMLAASRAAGSSSGGGSIGHNANLSLAKHVLDLPPDAMPNPLVAASPAAAANRAPRAATPNGQTGLRGSASHTQVFAELNPTRRPSPLAHPNAVPRPTAASTSGGGNGGLRTSASAKSLVTTSTRPSLSVSLSSAALHSPPTRTPTVGYTVTQADGSPLPLGPRASHARLPTPSGSPIESQGDARGLVQRIKQQDQFRSPLKASASASSLTSPAASAASFTTPQRKSQPNSPADGAMLPPLEPTLSTALSPHRNAFTVGIPVSNSPSLSSEEKEDALAAAAAASPVLLRGKATPFAHDTTDVARMLGALSGKRAKAEPKIGYAAARAAAAAAAALEQESEPEHERVEGWGSGENGSGLMDVSGAVVPPGFTVIVSPVIRSPKEKVVARAPVVVPVPRLDPDWMPHPAMDSSSPTAYFAHTSDSNGSAPRARSAANIAAARRDPSYIFAPPSATVAIHTPVLQAASPPPPRSPTGPSWDTVASDASAAASPVVGDAAIDELLVPLQTGTTFASFVRPTTQIGLIANGNRER